MSTHDDNLLTPRFAALAPQPLPGDWHDVLGRAGPAPAHLSRCAKMSDCARWNFLPPSNISDM